MKCALYGDWKLEGRIEILVVPFRATLIILSQRSSSVAMRFYLGTAMYSH